MAKEQPVIGDSSEKSPHHFSFDLDRAIKDQVIKRLRESPKLKLEKSIGPQESGIYALWYNTEIVYVGKASKETTKSGRTLRMRLNEHISKIDKRRNITTNEIEVQFLTFDSEWWVFAAEFVLIADFKPQWNYSGFGSKVPGRGRPGTERVSSFDELFPPKPGAKKNDEDDDD